MMNFVRAGLREIGRRKKIVWTWYGLNLLFAIVIVAPLVMAIAGALGQSLENKRLFDNFDPSWIAEFGAGAQWEQFTMWLPVLALAGGAFLFVTTWLSGGLLSVLRDPSGSFFAGCARWFPPFLRLLLMAAVGYGIAFGVHAGFVALMRKLSDDSMSGQPAAYGSMANFVVTWMAFSFVNMIVDYAKIHMVAHGERKARRGLMAGFRFVFANFRSCVTIYLALTGYSLLMLAAYHIWSEVIGQASIVAVLFLFVARQVYIFGRTWLRMVFLASEHAYLWGKLQLAASPPVGQPIMAAAAFQAAHSLPPEQPNDQP